jgi:L-ascorbate metabolism protein UlaG (beta-lactamase superfamily)
MQVGPFRIIAVPAVDGFGDLQHSWVIDCDEKRVIHAGDTLFHGYWWSIRQRYGPFEIAFVPICGAIVDFPHMQPPSPLPVVMTPEEAVVAAHLLGSRARRRFTMDHFIAPIFVETDRPVERFYERAIELGVKPTIRSSEEWFDV